MRIVAIIAMVCAFIPFAQAQKGYFDRSNVVHFEFDFGHSRPETDGDYFDFLENTTTFDRDDLDGQAFKFRVLYQLDNKIAVGGSIVHYDESITVEDNFYVDVNNLPILQTNTLETTWVGASFVWTPFGAGETFGSRGWAPRRFVPYLSAGVGIKEWELRSVGEFVDDADPTDPIIFNDRFEDDGQVFSARFGCGIRFNLHKNLDLNLFAETDYAEDDLEGSFVGFGDLELSSKSGYIGIIFRL